MQCSQLAGPVCVQTHAPKTAEQSSPPLFHRSPRSVRETQVVINSLVELESAAILIQKLRNTFLELTRFSHAFAAKPAECPAQVLENEADIEHEHCSPQQLGHLPAAQNDRENDGRDHCKEDDERQEERGCVHSR